MRFFFATQPVKIFIKDQQEMLISIENAKSNIGTPYLWSNNPILINIIQQWYDIIWEKASKECPMMKEI